MIIELVLHVQSKGLDDLVAGVYDSICRGEFISEDKKSLLANKGGQTSDSSGGGALLSDDGRLVSQSPDDGVLAGLDVSLEDALDGLHDKDLHVRHAFSSESQDHIFTEAGEVLPSVSPSNHDGLEDLDCGASNLEGRIVR